MITVREAKLIAKDWIEAEASNIPKFHGALAKIVGQLPRNERE